MKSLLITLICLKALLKLIFVCNRTLDNGEVEFTTERCTQTCHKESGKDQRAIEDIGPQEEGDAVLKMCVVDVYY